MKLGIERREVWQEKASDWGTCALLANHSSVDKDMSPSWQLIREVIGKNLRAIFSPQHGYDATVQDNMIESGHVIHKPSGLQVFSLYSETREPTEEMLKGIDTILIDLQISGTRVYTFKYTMAACLRAAKKYGKSVVVFDRPNPLGGRYVEGRVLELNVKSFVGEFPIPMRHGLTAGELCSYFNRDIGAPLEVIHLDDWDPNSLFEDHARFWLPTSPNLPTYQSAAVYPGTVMLEGTNISEGRGTSLPFQLVGAPYLESSETFIDRVYSLNLERWPRRYLRPSSFQPTSQKWVGQTCRGLQILVPRSLELPVFGLGLALIRAGIELGGGGFDWKQPPYEYNYHTLPIKLILGSEQTVKMFKAQHFSLADEYWNAGVSSFIKEASAFLIYPRKQILLS